MIKFLRIKRYFSANGVNLNESCIVKTIEESLRLQ